MLDITTFFANDARVQVYRKGTCDPEGKYVLYWMQRAQRGYENPALNAAIALGNTLNLPVVVLFVVTEYPAANLRHYTFMLEGITVTARDLQQRGTPLIMRKGEPATQVLAVAQELQVAAIISDENPLRLPQAWRQEVTRHTHVPFACVDADVVVPSQLFPKEEWAAYTLRPKLQKLLPTYLQPVIDLEPLHKLDTLPCDTGAIDEPLRYLSELELDRSVGPSTYYHGGQHEGKRLLQRFIQERLDRYGELRNIPEIAGTSEISAYLHFGQISVQQVAWEIEQTIPPTTGSASIDADDGRAKFIEEMVVRRELAINYVLHNPHYDTLEGCPPWARETLQKHASDPREWNYSLTELEQARTHDELWNASQREMVVSGRMHGYMRMYWAKRILEWTNDPAEALQIAIYLNDKYELDGRDANGYTGIAWSIGGKHDRPLGPERPIFGLIRYMAPSGMERKMDTRAYSYKWRKM